MLKKVIYSLMAGIAIAMGATIYVLCSNKIVGAFMFSIGILLVMEFKMLLFTGYVPTQRENQKLSDYLINSTLIYELPVLKKYIEPLLIAVTTESPYYKDAKRLLDIISYFVTLADEQNIPSTSILKEFIGGSTLL